MGEIMVRGSPIEGVLLQPLTQIKDQRGMVMHMLRVDSSCFEGFGEIYFSVINQGVVKAWRRHQLMIQHLAVPIGEIKLVIYDCREGTSTRGAQLEIYSGIDKYGLVRIPPMVWYGFQGLAEGKSMIVNCTSIPYDEEEVERVESDSKLIPYSW